MQRSSAAETTVWYDQDDRNIVVSDATSTVLEGELSITATDPTDPAAVSVTDITLKPSTGGVTLSLMLENEGSEPVTLENCTVTFETAFGSDSRVYRHGYQSWTPTGSHPVGERFPEEPSDASPMMLDLEAPADMRTSSYVVGFHEADRSITVGYLDHDRFCTRFDVDDDQSGVHTVQAVCPFEGLRLEPGERITVPDLWIDATRPLRDGLAAWADLVGERMDARVPTDVPTGWCSWYHYFTDVTEADVRENLDELRDWGIPVDVVQLDDGYMEAFGDWRSIADGFTEMGELATDIKTAGYTPGLWIAPFYVESGANLHANHPEWFVTEPGTGGEDEPGVSVDGGFRSGSHLYGLDTTHPEVLNWLRDTFKTISDEWGYRYLKLDFLFAAALPGDRYDETATRVEAYRRGMAAIDDAVDDDVFLLGCGAPMAPSVGTVDAMRIGPDTDPVWESPSDSASQPGLKNAVRNTLTRQYLHRRWWINDPDCQLVRETSDLTRAEREAFATLVSMTGGVNVFSDRIAEIDDDGRQLLERSLPPTETASVEGLATETLPSCVVCDRLGDGATTVVLFNWDDEPSTVRFDVRDYTEGMADGEYEDLRVWDGLASESRDEIVFEQEIPAHGAALFAVVSADTGPVVGDSSTLSGGGNRIRDIDQGDGSLHATVDDWRFTLRTD